ncbi:nucleic acid dioxygenase ALKBH1 [Aricia agestis]|uniref:nucleic acid dioxygenase ALKBH1 n=1 Tax=Aricia agestis TaxID=91739 RepID=UPI001C2023D0|nr:nucleic acid dioxygenase ALKBH1 [Aricia agestis]XP_041981523.1 nucleic acid dioxygenase ALKBH1 [Aricia agestis]
MEYKDNFMKIFKYYKSNKPQPSFKEVISLGEEVYKTKKVVKNNVNISEIDHRLQELGLENQLNWNIYSFLNHPGLIFIRNPFTALGQRYWIKQCLEEYTKKPNKLNIDNEICLQDWWSECVKDENNKFYKKLRWTTLGYHHNWDTKVYSEDNKNEFPHDLAELCKVIAKALGFDDFRAEAAIVNYYHIGSTLSAHTDHSEVNLDAPLLSFSFGQSAIFLIGGKDKSVEPTPILINSGDVVIMSKEARLCYHAVPRILRSSNQPWNDLQHKEPPSKIKKTEESETNNFRIFSKYVEESRININVRQVLHKTQKSLTDAIL